MENGILIQTLDCIKIMIDTKFYGDGLKASELIVELQKLIDKYGDKYIHVWDSWTDSSSDVDRIQISDNYFEIDA